MRALTIWQPWVDCILFHGKDVENRGWRPPSYIIGQRIALHAGKKLDEDGILALRLSESLILPDSEWDAMEATSRRGAIVGTVIVRGSISRSASRWFHGPWGWILEDARPLRPIPCRGAQGLWRMSPELEAEIEKQERGESDA